MEDHAAHHASIPSWLIYACRSAYAAEVAEIIWRSGASIAMMIDNLSGDPLESDLATVKRLADLSEADRALATVIPLITPGHRHAVVLEAMSAGIDSFPSLIDATSVVARTASYGYGLVVNALAVIGARSAFGDFVHVNRSASIGHDDTIGDFATLGPGCVLAGHVSIGSGAFVGAGAVIGPRVFVGANAVVGAGAVVVRDVAEATVVAGNPAKVIADDSLGYGGVLVPVDGYRRFSSGEQ